VALITGQRTTLGYDNTATVYDGANEKLDISTMLSLLEPYESPLLQTLGMDGLTATQIKHEWLEDDHRGLSATTTDTDLNNTSSGSVVLTLVTAGDYLKFRGGAVASAAYDIVLISTPAGSEVVPVTATANNTITVTRGTYSGTGGDPIDHTGYTKTITIIGRAQAQGLTTVGTSITTIKANKYNYTQIFEDSYSQSRTERDTAKWTMQDDRAYSLGKKMTELLALLERSVLYGLRATATASVPQTMNGIRAYITTNSYDKAGAALTQSFLEQALVDIWNADSSGGGRKIALVNATQQRQINTFFDSFKLANYTDEVLGQYVTRYRTRFGEMDLMLNRNLLDTEVLIITPANIKVGPLTGGSFGTTPIAPTSREAFTTEITGEYTCEVRLEKTHALIKNLATTGLSF
jgi:hypothetical protein